MVEENEQGAVAVALLLRIEDDLTQPNYAPGTALAGRKLQVGRVYCGLCRFQSRNSRSRNDADQCRRTDFLIQATPVQSR
jgi:hypothetical protein